MYADIAGGSSRGTTIFGSAHRVHGFLNVLHSRSLYIHIASPYKAYTLRKYGKPIQEVASGDASAERRRRALGVVTAQITVAQPHVKRRSRLGIREYCFSTADRRSWRSKNQVGAKIAPGGIAVREYVNCTLDTTDRFLLC